AVLKSHNTAPVWACRPTTRPSWVPISTMFPATVGAAVITVRKSTRQRSTPGRGVQSHDLPRGRRDIDGVVGNGRRVSDVAADASRPHAALLDRRGRPHTPEGQVGLPKQQRPLPWVGGEFASGGTHSVDSRHDEGAISV